MRIPSTFESLASQQDTGAFHSRVVRHVYSELIRVSAFHSRSVRHVYSEHILVPSKSAGHECISFASGQTCVFRAHSSAFQAKGECQRAPSKHVLCLQHHAKYQPALSTIAASCATYQPNHATHQPTPCKLPAKPCKLTANTMQNISQINSRHRTCLMVEK